MIHELLAHFVATWRTGRREVFLPGGRQFYARLLCNFIDALPERDEPAIWILRFELGGGVVGRA